MRTIISFSLSSAALLALCVTASIAQQPPAQAKQDKAPPPPMSFFITSVGKGNGANLGGLAGADQYCQLLAQGVGAGNQTWRAYLSTQAANGQPAVNARDRIGKGPWYNQKGQVIGRDLAHLHGDTLELARLGNSLLKNTARTEKGDIVNGVGDTPNTHDILTGTQPDGTAYADAADHTCSNWTSEAETGSAQLGHFDRNGANNTSWNSSHASTGCSQAKLVSTGGAGLLYCFATGPR